MKTMLSALALTVALVGPAVATPIIYVDGGDHGIEYRRVLTDLGYSYTIFNSYSNDDWSTALSNANVILVGERHTVNLSTSAATRTALSSFVSNGGTFIGHSPNNTTSGMRGLFNSTFGMSLQYGTQGCGSTNSFTLDTGAAAGTSFEGGPATLDDPSCTFSVRTASLPIDALSLYSNSIYTSVFAMGFGEGQLAMLGWDFCTNCANTTDRNAWAAVLDRAIRFDASPAAAVPEAGTVGLLGFGLAAVAAATRRRKVA